MLLAVSFIANAQEKLSTDSTQLMFDDNGDLTMIKVKPDDVKDKIITKNPRYDDVVWKKTVLRVVDMREQQNRPLYYPCEELDSTTAKNLYAIILSNVLDGKIKAYKSKSNFAQTYCPQFTKENELNINEFVESINLTWLPDTWSKVNYLNPGIVKYYVKMVYYFNKSTSTFHNRILAIAPLYDENYGKREDLHTSVFFWVPFEKLRPYLQEDYVKMNGKNTISKVTFDDFFISGYYNSYIMKDYDVTGNDIDRGLTDPRMIRQEQDRVEGDIIEFEQDLWAY